MKTDKILKGTTAACNNAFMKSCVYCVRNKHVNVFLLPQWSTQSLRPDSIQTQRKRLRLNGNRALAI